ncbi:hypothetical protein GCM10009603_56470 [Nocardiopsis exhalans]
MELTVTASRSRRADLRQWRPEGRCREAWGDRVRPDATCAGNKDGQVLDAFVEYDTGTEPHSRLADKLVRYHFPAQSSGLPSTVLFLVPSARRMSAMCRNLTPESSVRARVATHNQLSSPGPDRPTWRQLADPAQAPGIHPVLLDAYVAASTTVELCTSHPENRVDFSDETQLRAALFRYNPWNTYVDNVMSNIAEYESLLTTDHQVPANTEKDEIAAERAVQQLGKPYARGGMGPTAPTAPAWSSEPGKPQASKPPESPSTRSTSEPRSLSKLSLRRPALLRHRRHPGPAFPRHHVRRRRQDGPCRSHRTAHLLRRGHHQLPRRKVHVRRSPRSVRLEVRARTCHGAPFRSNPSVTHGSGPSPNLEQQVASGRAASLLTAQETTGWSSWLTPRGTDRACRHGHGRGRGGRPDPTSLPPWTHQQGDLVGPWSAEAVTWSFWRTRQDSNLRPLDEKGEDRVTSSI